ncbi:MAG: hypothetical protein ACOY4D_05420 [Pseudomonadota bacterium]
MKFDIAAGTPPTADEFDGERERLEGRLARITRLGWTVIGLLVLLCAGLWLAWWQGGMVNSGLLVGGAVVAVVGGKWWSDSRTGLSEALARLDPAPREECVAIAGWCGQDMAVDAYRAAVVGLGRQITQGEFLAMKDWVEGATARQDAEENQRMIEEACRKVYGVTHV